MGVYTQGQIKDSLKILYPCCFERVYQAVVELIEKWRRECFPKYRWIDNSDVLMIAYGDAVHRKGEAPLSTLKKLMDAEFRGDINIIHLLPMFPYSSDDGFSVIDFRKINPDLGTWKDIEKLNSAYDLMFDAVINHVSRESPWFKGFAEGNPAYRDFFITADPNWDYTKVVRPRSLPLLTRVETLEGPQDLWTTFSEDQIDLNYKNPAVLLEILDILLLYASRGARFIRFDAIGFAWKETGTSCMHLRQVHEMVKLMCSVLQSCAPLCSIITETNVPHAENISYFGNGCDEAALVYQFPLPPLVLFSFLMQDASRLTEWAASLEPTGKDTAYFNFLASHDGIGLRPVEGLLSDAERDFMVRETLARGGQIGYRSLSDGSEVPYELNINYLDAIAGDGTEHSAVGRAPPPDTQRQAQKFMASQCILLSMMGMPAVYYHSLFGSRGDPAAYKESGIKRRINREKLDADLLMGELRQKGTLRNLVADRFRHLIGLRKTLPAFHPNSPQRVLTLKPEVFALLRGEGAKQVLVLVNVSGKQVTVQSEWAGTDLVGGEVCGAAVELAPWQYRWIRVQ
ncbi:sucrose phosphorylase [Spirochaetia bacterium]|nr:sucrose phosphorylase [Spirochaetia bacterium]